MLPEFLNSILSFRKSRFNKGLIDHEIIDFFWRNDFTGLYGFLNSGVLTELKSNKIDVFDFFSEHISYLIREHPKRFNYESQEDYLNFADYLFKLEGPSSYLKYFNLKRIIEKTSDYNLLQLGAKWIDPYLISYAMEVCQDDINKTTVDGNPLHILCASEAKIKSPSEWFKASIKLYQYGVNLYEEHEGKVAIDSIIQVDMGSVIKVKGCSLIHFASFIGDKNTLHSLLNNGEDVNRRTRKGLTPLACALCSEDISVVNLLLEKGGVIDQRVYLNKKLFDKREYIFIWEMAFFLCGSEFNSNFYTEVLRNFNHKYPQIFKDAVICNYSLAIWALLYFNVELFNLFKGTFRLSELSNRLKYITLGYVDIKTPGNKTGYRILDGSGSDTDVSEEDIELDEFAEQSNYIYEFLTLTKDDISILAIILCALNDPKEQQLIKDFWIENHPNIDIAEREFEEHLVLALKLKDNIQDFVNHKYVTPEGVKKRFTV